MDKISVVGLDLAKNVFEVHAVSADGKVVAVALAKKSARVAWVLMVRHETYATRPA